MTHTRNYNPACRSLLMSVAVVALFLLPGNPRSEINNSGGNAKLTTVLAELAQSVPQHSGPTSLSSSPLTAGYSTASMPKSARDALEGREMRINSNGEVQVYILMNAVTEDNLSQLKANGVTIEIKDLENYRVQARVPVTLLQTVGALPFVNFIRLPTYAVRMTGSVDTEGDAILRADQARQQFSIDGTGVRVGVISDGLKGIFATNCTSCSGVTGGPISTGDLPSATGTRNASGVLTAATGGITGQSFQANSDLEGLPTTPCGFAGAGAEGTALLEIIHDIAPGAQLSFANAGTDIEFNQAVNTLAASNDIVTDDLGFFGLPLDGTSSVSINTANALNNSAFPIRGYFTAVGNTSDSHYLAPYTDSRTNGFSITGRSGDLHLFQASPDTVDTLSLGQQTYNEIKLQGTNSTGQSTGGQVVVILSWDDPFGSSTNNFGLYLVQHGTNSVVARDDGKTCSFTNGTTFPVSCLTYVNNGSADTYYDIIIQNPSDASAPKTLNLFAFTPECAFGSLISLGPSRAKMNFNTSSHSVIAESDAGGSPVSVISVGAICSASVAAQTATSRGLFPDPSCLDTTNSTIEYFSSQGPTLDGRTKPDISAIDGVSITGAGSFENPFFGSSAATPHVAGIAALLLQSKTCLLNGGSGGPVDNVTARTDLHNLIMNNAISLGASPPNNVFGFGRPDALASADATIPVSNGQTSFVVSGNTPGGASVTAPQIGFSVPNTCPMAKLSWTGGCGTGPSSNMNCPFGTSNVTVMASNNGISFSSGASVQVIVTNFSVGSSPGSATVTAGQSATFTATVTASGGAFNSPVTLGCSGLPASARCLFTPSAVTPGTTSAQSTLTISTTARALVPPGNTGPSGRLPQWSPVVWQLQRDIPQQALWLALFIFAILGWVGIRLAPLSYQRRLASLGAIGLAVAFFAIQVACGGGGSITPPPSGGTPAGTYNIGVSGTTGTLVQSSTATLTVQ